MPCSLGCVRSTTEEVWIVLVPLFKRRVEVVDSVLEFGVCGIPNFPNQGWLSGEIVVGLEQMVAIESFHVASMTV